MSWLSDFWSGASGFVGGLLDSDAGKSALHIAEQAALNDLNKQSKADTKETPAPVVNITTTGGGFPKWVIPAAIGGVGLLALILFIPKKRR
ncbi:MAG: hypothetical protein WC959_07490 [Kiritimatiellales bacterium]